MVIMTMRAAIGMKKETKMRTQWSRNQKTNTPMTTMRTPRVTGGVTETAGVEDHGRSQRSQLATMLTLTQLQYIK